MAKIAYLPFAGDEQVLAQVKGIVDKLRGRWGRQFEPDIKIHSDTTSVLAGVSTSTEVYIFCHGGAGSNEVADSDGHRLTTAELASRLYADGLSPAHKTLKLYSCHSADGGTASTAYRLWRALFDLRSADDRFQGYKSLDVYGYAATLITDGEHAVSARGHKQAANPVVLTARADTPLLPSTRNFLRAKEVRVKFGVSYRAPA